MYEHVEPHLEQNKMSLKDFMETSVMVMDKVEIADQRSYCSHPAYYLDFSSPFPLPNTPSRSTTILAEFEQKIQHVNPTNCYEDVNDAVVHHQLTALALEVYYELVNFMEVYKIANHPMLYRSVVGWRGQNMLVKVCRRS